MKINSQRVIGKNFKSFNGKPLFQWILKSLLEIPEISKIVINTDAENLLNDFDLFDLNRVQIRSRRPEICGDLISMNTIIADDISNVPADVYLMTHTTNPILKSSTIKDALNTFLSNKAEGNFDSLFTVNRIQTRFYHKDGSAINHDPNNLIRTQDLEPWYEENSNLYIFTSESFRSAGARIGNFPFLYETPRIEAFDIDDIIDWQIAEAVAKYIDISNLS